MRVVLYCRVSTIDGEQLTSLKHQIQHYEEILNNKDYKKVNVGMLYSKERGSEPLEGIFADEGISGTKKKNRKAFEYMMECAKNKAFDLIIVKNIPRFARNVGDGANDLKLLKSFGIDVHFEDGNLRFSQNEATINVLLTMAQEESRAKSTAVQFGIRKSQSEGKWTSNCPYGYNRVNGYLEINAEEAEVVKKIYDLYVNLNYGQNKILKYLINNNVPTKKGGSWWQQHVQNILINPLYKGIQTTHKSVNKDVNIILVKDVPSEEWIQHIKEELKIIDEELWKKAQDKFKERTIEHSNHHRHSDVNLLSTVLKCGNCGSTMRRKKKKTKLSQNTVWTGEYEWVCQNNDLFGKDKCSFRNRADESYLIDFCKKNIVGYREHKRELDKRFEEYLETYYNLDTQTKLENLQNLISDLKKSFQNKIRLNDKGLINDKELEEFLKEYRKEVNEYEEEEYKLKNINIEIEKSKRRYNEFIKYLCQVDVNKLTNADLKKIFAAITVTTIDMQMYLSSDDEYQTDGYLSYNEILAIPYSFYNENKKLLKHTTAEFMFMDKKETDIFENWEKLFCKDQ